MHREPRISGLFGVAAALIGSGAYGSEPSPLPAATLSKVHEDPQSPNTASVWPDELANLQRQVLTSQFAVFASDLTVAQGLRDWIDSELLVFNSRFGSSVEGPGLVLAIGPGEQLDPRVEAWRKEHPRPARDWWRRYCLDGDFGKVYFIESFSMPVSVAKSLGVLPVDVHARWVCFLTTDVHQAAAFDKLVADRIERRGTDARPRSRTGSPSKDIEHAVGLKMMELMYGIMAVWYRSIDRSLMNLHRREVLWTLWLDQTMDDDVGRAKAVEDVHREIDAAWRRLYENRPID
jgi:hypothetical protein